MLQLSVGILNVWDQTFSSIMIPSPDDYSFSCRTLKKC